MAGVVIFCRDLVRLSAFYASLVGAEPVGIAEGHVELPGDLVLVQAAGGSGGSGAEATVKAVLDVPDVHVARASVTSPGDVWEWRGTLRCDGADPEGNVIQLRQRI